MFNVKSLNKGNTTNNKKNIKPNNNFKIKLKKKGKINLKFTRTETEGE